MHGGNQEIRYFLICNCWTVILLDVSPGYGYVAAVFSTDMFDISINISKRRLVSEWALYAYDNHALAKHNTPIALA